MQGAFESREGGHDVARETWSLEAGPAGRTLKASGTEGGGDPRTWWLESRLGTDGEVVSVELQVRPADRPAEVTTTALRCFGGRLFATTIPPGGVPEKFETAFGRGAAVRGFSTAQDGLMAAWGAPPAGHGRRLLVVELETGDLRPRVADAVLLARARERAKTPSGEAWCVRSEFRWAEAPGRTVLTLLATKQGLVLRAEAPGRAPPRTTALTSFQP